MNRSVRETLDEITQQQLLLGAKLNAALDAPVFTGPTGAGRPPRPPGAAPRARGAGPRRRAGPESALLASSAS